MSASVYHVPVLRDEVLEYLNVVPGGLYVDGTLGGGGHTRAILEASAPDGRVLGLDRDPDALAECRRRLESFGDRMAIVEANYADAARVAEETFGRKVDGFLVDAGVSSHQLDTAERGFSFSKAGPLDMRMSPQDIALDEYLESVELAELTRVLKVYGEVQHAKRLARAILEAHGAGELGSTLDLASVVERFTPRAIKNRRQIHPATQVFQALRIAVNDELTWLERVLETTPEFVRSGGRVVMISFHSLEDRIVKQAFRAMAKDRERVPRAPVDIEIIPKIRVLTRKPVVACADEVTNNPRSRSAKLRAAEVV